jgi:TolB protein
MLGRWFRKRAPALCSQLTLIGPDGANRRVLYESQDTIEAPTWTPDGRWLVFNGNGQLWRLPADGSGPPEAIDTGGLGGASNDHLVAPDGETVYFTAAARIYAVALHGGPARAVLGHRPGQPGLDCYLHGIAPNGQTLSFVGVRCGAGVHAPSLCTLNLEDGTLTTLTQGLAGVDGPEFSPDGQWIYFNAEPRGSAQGHAQIFRMRSNGAQVEQLSFDARVNWFPHPSPDGRRVMYLSYPEKTQGHPANLAVVLRSIPATGGTPVDVVAFQGGQGSSNANGWAPDGQHFAYMAYPPRSVSA